VPADRDRPHLRRADRLRRYEWASSRARTAPTRSPAGAQPAEGRRGRAGHRRDAAQARDRSPTSPPGVVVDGPLASSAAEGKSSTSRRERARRPIDALEGRLRPAYRTLCSPSRRGRRRRARVRLGRRRTPGRRQVGAPVDRPRRRASPESVGSCGARRTHDSTGSSPPSRAYRAELMYATSRS
jgi:hypothetical protein